MIKKTEREINLEQLQQMAINYWEANGHLQLSKTVEELLEYTSNVQQHYNNMIYVKPVDTDLVHKIVGNFGFVLVTGLAMLHGHGYSLDDVIKNQVNKHKERGDIQ